MIHGNSGKKTQTVFFPIDLPSRSLTVRPWKVTFPIRKDRLPTINFQGRTVKLRGCITLQGTNISPKNGILKMIFLFPGGIFICDRVFGSGCDEPGVQDNRGEGRLTASRQGVDDKLLFLVGVHAGRKSRLEPYKFNTAITRLVRLGKWSERDPPPGNYVPNGKIFQGYLYV